MTPPLSIAFYSSPVTTLVPRSEFPYTDQQVRVIKLSEVINDISLVAYHITVVNFDPTTSIVPLTVKTEQVFITVLTDREDEEMERAQSGHFSPLPFLLIS